jgi:hypothetical protein
MTENEAIQLAQEYLDYWRIQATGLRSAALIHEQEALSIPDFTGPSWYVVFTLPPLPEEFQAIDPDPAVVLCVNCLSKKVRQLRG